MSGQVPPALLRDTRVTVQRVDAGNDQRHAGVMIGNYQDEFLVVGGFAGVEFEVGERVIVRMLLGGDAVGYETTVREVSGVHAKLYVLDFPERVVTHNLRRAHRIQVFVPADVRTRLLPGSADEVRLLKAMMLNISGGGCFYSSKQAVPTDSEINIAFSLPGDRHVHNIVGKVLDRRPHNAIFGQRVRFAESAANLPAAKDVARWVEQNLSYALG